MRARNAVPDDVQGIMVGLTLGIVGSFDSKCSASKSL